MILLLSLLQFSIAKEPDPWGRPAHPRVVAAPAKSWSALFDSKTTFSFFWDESDSTATIQMQGSIRWKTIATDASSGWVSKSLPKDATFRIQLKDAERASPLIETDPWYTPSALAYLDANKQSSLAKTMGEITSNGTDIYVASLTGGLTQVSDEGIKNWTRWDGLPSDRVLSVTAQKDRVLVGTAEGMALIETGAVIKVWDDELSDPYVQSVGIFRNDFLAGTYHGLDRVQGSTTTNLLPEWSIFSILVEEGGVMWIGYEGITRWSVLDEHSIQEWPGNVSAIELSPNHLYMATEKKGVVAVTQEETDVIFEGEVTGLTYDGKQLWMAAGPKGLINRKGEPTAEVSSSVWSVESQDEDLFLGTSDGIQRFTPSSKELIRYPVSSWATDMELNDILPNEKGAFLAHRSGLSIIGRPHPKAGVFKNNVKEDVIELIEKNELIYAIGTQNLYTLSPDGAVTKTVLSGRTTSATWFLNRLWISTTEGIFSYQAETKLLDFVYDINNITALASSPNSLWGVSDKGTLIDIKPTKSFTFDKITSPLSIAPSGLALCVGTEDGIYRIWKGRAEQVEDILGTQDLDVAIYAVAADDKQGCWVAGEDGSIGRLSAKGDASWLKITDPELPKITKIIPQGDQAWILTEAGTWLVTLKR